jgi:hypothetical protein
MSAFGQNFEVVEEPIALADGTIGSVTKLIFNKAICPELHQSMLGIVDEDDFYSDIVKRSPQSLARYFDVIQSKASGDDFYLLPLAFYLADVFKDDIKKYENMSADGKVTFKFLSKIFTIGKKFATTHQGQLIGSMITATNVSADMMGEHFNICGKFTVGRGTEFIQEDRWFSIDEFKGAVFPKDLTVHIMTDEEEALLVERGLRFRKYAIGTNYLTYKGNMFVNTYFGPSFFRADGRVMVDYNGHRTMNPNSHQQHHHYHGTKQEKFSFIPNDLLYMTWPFLYGFSFFSKRWGEMYVDGLSDAVFDDKAFDMLVLDEEKKTLSKALVMNASLGFTDIISGKSGGCIFLLYGPPGTGKTLTSEAIAEFLHKPIYSITVGELGDNAKELETNLTRILEIAGSWGAVLLLDEADIFMEKRSIDNIKRNAMVSIFLRLLERYSGVMFLTTNRATTIDDAFKSRISVCIEYKSLDVDSRKKVWFNLLKAAEITLTETGDLAEDGAILALSQLSLNGREIKTAIRNAQCMALYEKTPVSFKHLMFAASLNSVSLS